MDEKELAKHLRDISTRTARIDERTVHMESSIEELKTADSEQDVALESLDRRVHRNTMVTNGIIFTLSSAVVAFFNKLGAILRLV